MPMALQQTALPKHVSLDRLPYCYPYRLHGSRWDAATGLGMPNMKVLIKAALKYVQLQKQQMDMSCTRGG